MLELAGKGRKSRFWKGEGKNRMGRVHNAMAELGGVGSLCVVVTLCLIFEAGIQGQNA